MTTYSPRTWGLLLVLCGAFCLDNLDVSMVGVALPSIGRSLSLSTSELQWVVSGYVLGYGGLLLLRRAPHRHRRPAQGLPRRDVGVRDRLDPRRRRQRRQRPDRDPLHQGHRRSV